jgi:NitT/TauT family transport system substrate-binding protein
MSTPPDAAGLGGSKAFPHRLWWIAGLVLLASAVAATVVLSVSRRTGAGPAIPLTIALSSTPHAALLHLAAAQGYFADEGLDVSVTLVSHGKAALDLLYEGRADLAAAAEVPFVIGVLEGRALRMVASMLASTREMAVVARRDRGIAAAADLAGKRVGVTFGTSGDYFLWALLTRNQLLPERVTFVHTQPDRIVAALESGAIDAAALWQPLRREAEATLGGQGVTFTAPDAYTVTHVVVGQARFLQDHAEAARRLVRALLRAEARARSEPAHAIRAVALWLRTDPAELQASWTDLRFHVDLRQSQLITWEDQTRWAMARGLAKPGPVPNFLDSLHLDALEAARPDRVTIVH